LRKQVSLLLANGHRGVHSYPLYMLIDEARIVNERLNATMAMQAALTQMAVASLFSDQGVAKLKSMLARLTDG
jgi:hypothetical protein